MTDAINYKALADEMEGLGEVEFDADFYALGEYALDNLPAILSALRRAGEMEAALRDVLSIWDRDGLLDKIDPGDVRALDAARAALKDTST